mmetsp:Transcript_6912/g.20371  ORF Transcript_6912/g.20371 Transcript_6912/m.20371 type:complete len:214 (+) Transcript_6912:401-1042(+)
MCSMALAATTTVTPADTMQHSWIAQQVRTMNAYKLTNKHQPPMGSPLTTFDTMPSWYRWMQQKRMVIPANSCTMTRPMGMSFAMKQACSNGLMQQATARMKRPSSLHLEPGISSATSCISAATRLGAAASRSLSSCSEASSVLSWPWRTSRARSDFGAPPRTACPEAGAATAATSSAASATASRIACRVERLQCGPDGPGIRVASPRMGRQHT